MFSFLQNTYNGNLKTAAAPVKRLRDTALDVCMDASPMKRPRVNVPDTAVDMCMDAPPRKRPHHVMCSLPFFN
jgi:hypothetical protein